MKLRNIILGITLLLIGIGIGASTNLSRLRQVEAATTSAIFGFEHRGVEFEILPTDYGIMVREHNPWGSVRVIDISGNIFIREYFEDEPINRFIEVRPLGYSGSYPPTPFPDILVSNFDFRGPNGTGTHMLITRNESAMITEFEDGDIIERFIMAYEDGSARLLSVETGERIYIGDGNFVMQAPDRSQGSVHRTVTMHSDNSVEVIESRWSGNFDEGHEHVVVAVITADRKVEIGD